MVLKKAFDGVPKKVMGLVMRKNGVSYVLVRSVLSIYKIDKEVDNKLVGTYNSFYRLCKCAWNNNCLRKTQNQNMPIYSMAL